MDNDDYEAFCKRFHITDSKKHHYSSNLINSEFVWHSHDVSQSKWIYRCNDVHDSHSIFDSQDVTNSLEVSASTKITNSRYVIESSDITGSQYILNSQHLIDANHINDCKNLERCDFIYNSSNLTDSMFCGNCSDHHHLLFCYDFHDQNYCIFNTPVSPTKFEELYELTCYLSARDRFNPSFIKINSYIYYDVNLRYTINRGYDGIFDGLSKEFIGRLGARMPQFSEELFLKLFFPDGRQD